MTDVPPADLLVHGSRVFTADPARPWVDAFVVKDGRIVASGTVDDLEAFVGPGTARLDTGGRLVLPGLSDGHAHLGLGGGQVAWELSIDPRESVETVLSKVSTRASTLAADEWIVGGIVSGSILYEAARDAAALDRLDHAAGGRPVLLRDDSMHNRWVNSRALDLMGVGAETGDPSGGRFVRDSRGRHTGVLFESTSALAEAAHDASIAEPAARHRVSLRAAIATMNSFGFTAIQDAATMAYSLTALSELDAAGELTAWVVTSTPMRPFIEAGIVGEELAQMSRRLRSRHVRPDFVKIVLDGVAQTRTSAMIAPYVKHHHDDPDVFGEPYWTADELRDALAFCAAEQFDAKVHATGDGAARLVLDVVERMARTWGNGPRVQVAHAKILDPEDLPRFAALGVDVDAAPYVWSQSSITDALRDTVGDERVDRSWPIRDLMESGAIVAAGTDWPCVEPTPNPWIGIETMVTRTNVDRGRYAEPLNASQAVGLEQAVMAFTRGPAMSMGIGDLAGTIEAGRSADFILVDQDIFSVDITEVHSTRVDATYFEGRLVFERTS
jgi:predicted amidohydrolase YtcJ